MRRHSFTPRLDSMEVRFMPSTIVVPATPSPVAITQTEPGQGMDLAHSSNLDVTTCDAPKPVAPKPPSGLQMPPYDPIIYSDPSPGAGLKIPDYIPVIYS